MKAKKILAILLVLALSLTSIPANAMSLPPNLTPRFGSGYYPTGVITPSKYYSYFLGGTRQSALAQLTYGNASQNLSIEVVEISYCIPGTLQFGSGPLGFYHGNEVVEYNYTLSSNLLSRGAYIEAIEVTLRIGPTRIVNYLRSS